MELLSRTPIGQTVSISLDGKPYRFRIDEDVSLDVSSDFGELIGNKVNDFFSVLSANIGIFRDLGISGQHKALGYQIWKSTDPVSCSLTLYKYQDEDIPFKYGSESLSAGESLLIFTKSILKCCVPLESGGGFLFPPGPNLLSALGLIDEDSGKEKKEEIAKARATGDSFVQKVIDTLIGDKDKLKPPRINIEIGGYLIFKNVIIKKITPIFSSITSKFISVIDKRTYYAPLNVQFQIEFSTTMVATTNVIEDIFSPTL